MVVRSLFEVKFRENMPEGSFITNLTTEDEDGDSLLYEILSDHLKQLFSLDPESGHLSSLRVLDREETESYVIPISVTDGGGRNGFATIKLSLADENDNSPFFPVSEYKANIKSNLSVGASVLKVTAEDRDKGKNKLISYEIYETESSGVGDVFSINPDNGQISLRKTATGLENQVYQFFVRASDTGREPLYADVPVEILILSDLDQPPQFEEHEQFYFISEGSSVGQTVTTLRVRHRETDSGHIRYKISSTQYLAEDALFSVDQTGRVLLSNTLDRETEPVHRLIISAETDSSPGKQ